MWGEGCECEGPCLECGRRRGEPLLQGLPRVPAAHSGSAETPPTHTHWLLGWPVWITMVPGPLPTLRGCPLGTWGPGSFSSKLSLGN